MFIAPCVALRLLSLFPLSLLDVAVPGARPVQFEEKYAPKVEGRTSNDAYYENDDNVFQARDLNFLQVAGAACIAPDRRRRAQTTPAAETVLLLTKIRAERSTRIEQKSKVDSMVL